jgi:hypothetical protein
MFFFGGDALFLDEAIEQFPCVQGSLKHDGLNIGFAGLHGLSLYGGIYRWVGCVIKRLM